MLHVYHDWENINNNKFNFLWTKVIQKNFCASDLAKKVCKKDNLEKACNNHTHKLSMMCVGVCLHAITHIKGRDRYIFASLFLSIKERFCEIRKNVFLFDFKSSFRSWEKSKVRILDIQISWRHQMPKHKTRNAFYRIT